MLASNIAESSLTLCGPQQFCGGERDLRGGCNDIPQSPWVAMNMFKALDWIIRVPQVLIRLAMCTFGMPYSNIFWQPSCNAVLIVLGIVWHCATADTAERNNSFVGLWTIRSNWNTLGRWLQPLLKVACALCPWQLTTQAVPQNLTNLCYMNLYESIWYIQYIYP